MVTIAHLLITKYSLDKNSPNLTQTRMSQEVSKWFVNGLSYNLLIYGAYWGYNPLIRSPLILTSSETSKKDIRKGVL